MLKAIWLSDPHFTAEGLVHGHNTRTRLSSAVTHVNEHYKDAEFCIISGDMVNQETMPDYLAVKQHLDGLRMPYFPMMGNHDDRGIHRAIWEFPADCMDEFIQYSIATRDGLMICLDTHKTGEVEGEFCSQRMDWLKNKLETNKDTPVYLFMHHPPMKLNLPILDIIKNEDGEALLDLIQMYDNVKYLFIGHVHRPISGTIRGIPFSTMKAISFQAPPPVPDWNWDNFKPAHEAPAYGVIQFENGDVSMQYTQFCEYDVGIE
ncbi:MAG: metallophosphoesterase [Hyphomicrobiales bacterium]